MPRLGPKSGGGDGDGGEHIPAGEYIIALKSFRRQKAKSSGNEYLRCTWVICSGRCEGKVFYTNWSLDLSKEGTCSRWRVWMEACDVNEEIELGSTAEGTQAEGDQNLRDHFVGVPFVVTVKVELNGQYTNHDIEKIHYVRLWTEEQKDEMDRWLDAQENAGQPGGTPDVSDDDRPKGKKGNDWTDDQDYGPVGGGTQAGFAGGEGDDDIPF